MSLIINFITNNNYEVEEPNSGLFGFESWRKSLWGNSIMTSLGCEIIHTLKDSDLFVTKENLEKLEHDLLLIQNNVTVISNQTKIDEGAIIFRISNALQFIKNAKENNEIIGIYIG